jgi:putative transcriptional regulator
MSTVPNVAVIRRRIGRTQAQFAALIGSKIATISAWEQGRRRPSRIARRMLELISRSPDVVTRLDELVAAKIEEMLLAVEAESD